MSVASVAQVHCVTPSVILNVFLQAEFMVILSVAFHYYTVPIHPCFQILSRDLENLAFHCSPHIIVSHEGVYFGYSLCPARGVN